MTDQQRIVNVNITFKNTDATDALKNYATDKITGCLHKFLHQDTEVYVVLRVEKKRQIAEITLNCFGTNIKNSEESDDLYKSIDLLVDSLTNQLRRQKERLTKRH